MYEALTKKLTPYILYLVKELDGSYKEDLVQEGYLALIEAAAAAGEKKPLSYYKKAIRLHIWNKYKEYIENI